MSKTYKKRKECPSRRRFLQTLGGVAAGTALLGSCEDEGGSAPAVEAIPKDTPRARKPNPFVNDAGQPVLVCVTGEDVGAMVSAGLAAIGGLSKLVAAQEDVLIKPNCNAAGPYPSISSASCVGALMKEIGAVSSGAISVGDVGYEPPYEVYSVMRLGEVVSANGGQLLYLKDSYSVRRAEWPADKARIGVYREIYDAPVVISTCVLKRHHVARMTCAIKNMFGTIPGPNYTASRARLHERSNDFMADIAEVAGLVNPDLNVVDARWIQTVNGPFAEDGVPVKIDKLIICGDPVATDVYCAELMAQYDNFSPNSIQLTLDRAVQLGMGTDDLNAVEIVEISV